jgi:hypothetical protein
MRNSTKRHRTLREFVWEGTALQAAETLARAGFGKGTTSVVPPWPQILRALAPEGQLLAPQNSYETNRSPW